MQYTASVFEKLLSEQHKICSLVLKPGLDIPSPICFCKIKNLYISISKYVNYPVILLFVYKRGISICHKTAFRSSVAFFLNPRRVYRSVLKFCMRFEVTQTDRIWGENKFGGPPLPFFIFWKNKKCLESLEMARNWSTKFVLT